MARQSLGYLGPYRLLNVVHTGHASKIWQAYDDGKQQMVGIKTLVERFQKDREQLGLLRWEYRVGRMINHPRVLEIFGFDVDRGIPYVAMEWFSAPNLKLRIQLGADKIAHLAQGIVEQAADALAYFNYQGWVHRDIKPENFLLNDQGEVKLIDFALAVKSRSRLLRFFVPRSKIQGTRSYMSPEQIRGEVLDQRADIYSFGCMIHELISGKPPFTGTSTQELLNKHLKATPPSLEISNRNVSPEFGDLVRRCLAKDPSQRPSSAFEFLETLKFHRIFKVQPRPPQQTTEPTP